MNEIDPRHGLTNAEVLDRTARGEINKPPQSHFAEYGTLVSRNVLTLFNALIVPSAIALFALRDYRGAWAVSAMAVINTLIGLIQEIRAKYHLDRLALMSELMARVIRDGIEKQIPARDIVRGDIICLASGEPVVADGSILRANFLEIDESQLTGESEPIRRKVGDFLRSGSYAVTGDGTYSAERVGINAFIHQMTAAARAYRYNPGPLQRTLNVLIRVLTAIAVVLCGFYVVLYLIRDLPSTDLVQMVAATVTSLIPQGLVLLTTVSLTLGAMRLTYHGAIIQRLAAVESMASIDVLCTDKTGTLTTNNLTVDAIHITSGNESTVQQQLRFFVWASVDESNRTIQSLRTFLGKPEYGFTVIDQIPFQSQNRYSAVRLRTNDDEQVLVLGSLDALQHRFEPDESRSIQAIFQKLLPSGLRLLAFAESNLRGQFDGPLRPLALIALRDELRPDAAIVLQSLTRQGVRLVVLSGDHPETVRATISQVNATHEPGLLRTGTEFDSAPDQNKMFAETSVFGRVTPQQKVEIVKILQRQGRCVAMIGDGVNDILAVKSADLGIAMGAGTAATKAVAGLVLENNRFDLLPLVLAEGRSVVDNVRRAAKLFLLKNVYTLILIAVILGVLRDSFPFLPQQVTLLNALTIGGPVFLMLLSKAPPGVPVRSAFLVEIFRFVLGLGLPMGIAGLFVWQTVDGVETKRTVLLTTMILAGLGVVALIHERDRRLLGWIGFAFPVYVAAMYVPFSAYFFALTPLSLLQWITALAAAGISLLIGWLLSTVKRETTIHSQAFPEEGR